MFSRRGFFRFLMARVLGGLDPSFGFLDLAAGAFLGLTLRVVFRLAPRLLGGRHDGDLFLLTAFRVTPSGIPLLFDQRALPRG